MGKITLTQWVSQDYPLGNLYRFVTERKMAIGNRLVSPEEHKRDLELLAKIQATSKFKTDKELAARLGMNQTHLSSVKKGERKFSTIQWLKCNDIIGYLWATEALKNLLK